MSARPHIVWFRDDLRTADNPALSHASEAPVIAVYVLDTAGRPLGAAARWWLHGSLEALRRDLAAAGVPLVLCRGPAATCLQALALESDAYAVSWNRPAGPSPAEGDVEAELRKAGLAVRTFKANLLFEPDEVQTRSGGGFRVFTAFWRAARQLQPSRPLPAPSGLAGYAGDLASEELAAWNLRPATPDWAGGLRARWQPGEAAALARLTDFAESLQGYGRARDFPGRAVTSRLSPSLRFGEVSPRQLWHVVETVMQAEPAARGDGEKFLAEVGWREFSHQLLQRHPDFATRNFNPAFDHFPWRADAAALSAWKAGRTGYPIVDAGMRELWHTGWMHNRVRMIVASFLTKHLLIDWRAGEQWFWDTLVDADPANNPAGWQWVAGCGADAAPYFRVFNPVLQGEKFDADGAYTRHWLPELAALPDRWLHRPWEAPPAVLEQAGVRLGDTYPRPIVDHAAARKRALAAYESMKRPEA